MARTVRVSATQFAEKWGRRLSGATQDIRAGVERVDTSPTALAALKQDKMLQKITESIVSGKWARGLARVSLQEWRDAVINKGLGRIPAGVSAATSKMQEFGRQLIDHENAGLGMIEGLPDVTLEDSIARAAAWMRHMAEFRRT